VLQLHALAIPMWHLVPVSSTKCYTSSLDLDVVDSLVEQEQQEHRRERRCATNTIVMVEVWWSLLGAAIPAMVAGQAFRIKRRRAEEQNIKSARGREKSSDDIFVCERGCTSKRMLKKVGAFSKDPIPDTCVTVCGVSELDACSDACARTVCVNQHHVPNWNDVCLRRCQSECLKLSAPNAS
ncbi:hypothetical protein AKJ16_DCAP25538, partial [Drosera capensis]